MYSTLLSKSLHHRGGELGGVFLLPCLCLIGNGIHGQNHRHTQYAKAFLATFSFPGIQVYMSCKNSGESSIASFQMAHHGFCVVHPNHTVLSVGKGINIRWFFSLLTNDSFKMFSNPRIFRSGLIEKLSQQEPSEGGRMTGTSFRNTAFSSKSGCLKPSQI